MSEDRLTSIIVSALEALVKWLGDEHVPNAIIGAVGVSLIAQPRITKDIDGGVWSLRRYWRCPRSRRILIEY